MTGGSLVGSCLIFIKSIILNTGLVSNRTVHAISSRGRYI